MRPSWDEIFLEQALLMARRSTCLRRQVGAVLVRDSRAIASGYNGAPSGLLHCEEKGGCLREQLKVPSGQRQEICRALHAEQNVILQLAITGLSGKGATLYVTHFPCFTCAKLLVQLGIKRLIYLNGYPDDFSENLLSEAGVELVEKINEGSNELNK